MANMKDLIYNNDWFQIFQSDKTFTVKNQITKKTEKTSNYIDALQVVFNYY